MAFLILKIIKQILDSNRVLVLTSIKKLLVEYSDLTRQFFPSQTLHMPTHNYVEDYLLILLFGRYFNIFLN